MTMDFRAVSEAIAIGVRDKRRGAVGSFVPIHDPVAIRVRVMRRGAEGDLREVGQAVHVGIRGGIRHGGIETVLQFHHVGHAIAIVGLLQGFTDFGHI